MIFKHRTISPKRTCNKRKSNYMYYKNELAEDFNHHCGYTNCSDKWFGGQNTFQIDHLKPCSKYPELKNEYSNLVYCCSFVNRAKSNDDSVNYLDPCDVDYNLHFERDETGIIYGISPQAKYMVEHLKLNLMRYAIIWMLERIQNAIDQLNHIPESSSEIKSMREELNSKFIEYVEYLHANL